VRGVDGGLGAVTAVTAVTTAGAVVTGVDGAEGASYISCEGGTLGHHRGAQGEVLKASTREERAS
jgi:hypothetical protein